MLWFFCCITAKQTLPGPVVYFISSVLVSRKGDEVDTMVISTREASLCHLDMVAPRGSEGMICVVLNM